MQSERAIVLWLKQSRDNLEGWAEANPAAKIPAGYLVPTEPDLETRARIRISLRAQVATLEGVLGITSDAGDKERADHRDLQRIRDAVTRRWPTQGTKRRRQW